MPIALASFMICGRSWSQATMTTMLMPACLRIWTAGVYVDGVLVLYEAVATTVTPNAGELSRMPRA
eukprot:7384771-Prymnesium_polylepis.1